MTELLESVTGESGDFGSRGLGPGCESVVSFDVEADVEADMFGCSRVVQALGDVADFDACGAVLNDISLAGRRNSGTCRYAPLYVLALWPGFGAL